MTYSVHENIELQVAVTAHRDLEQVNADRVRREVREFFLNLQAALPGLPISLMSPLATGGDTLAAEVALELGLRLRIPLPMPQEIYESDFSEPEDLARFRSLCQRGDVFTLPMVDGVDREQLQNSSEARIAQYAQLGTFVSTHCQVLLALWDGEPSEEVGGTASVVHFHLYDEMPGFRDEPCPANILMEPDNDLVYHIHCPRSAEHPGILPPRWISRRGDASEGPIPPEFLSSFRYMETFRADVERYHKDIAQEGDTMLDQLEFLQHEELVTLDSLYSAADWLAIHFRKRVVSHLAVTHWLAVLMGFSFILYSEYDGFFWLLPTFLTLFFSAVVLNGFANKRHWHRKYLDYRTLAEGLRVQFYWSLSGIEGFRGAAVAYDNLLQKQDMELSWVRHIMRNCGTTIRVALLPPENGLELAVRHWIGGSQGRGGQLEYFSRAALSRARKVRRTDWIASVTLWVGISMAIALLFIGQSADENVVTAVLVLMGLLPLAAGIREAYTYKKADKELAKQYQFMLHTFTKAHDRIRKTSDPQEIRRVLRALGEACLEEHSEWVMIHRARPLEHSGLQT